MSIVRWIWDRLGKTRALGVAAEMSFWIFLSLVPLAAVAALVAARVALRDRTLLEPLVASLPPDAVRVVRGELAHVAAWNSGAVAPVAILVFVWLGTSGIHAVFDGFETQTGCSRPWWKKRALALLSCVALSFAVAALALLGPGVTWMRNVVGGSAPWWLFASVGFAARLVIAAALLYAVVAWLYLVGLPAETRQSMPLAPGTLAVVVLQLALAWGYRTYIATVGDGGAYQAGLAVIGVTMTTVYLFSVSILFGLEVNRFLAELQHNRTIHRENRGMGGPPEGPKMHPRPHAL